MMAGKYDRGDPAACTVPIDYGKTLDVRSSGEHRGQFFLIHEHFPWSVAEAFAVTLQGLYRRWRRVDGTPLEETR
ncbi:MAG: hypothetical protein KM310_03945 [Clostridiales bacterium]|nr:hypothetical protein [Clostridiales bacterium]